MTRAEHLDWAKARALAYLEPGPFYSIADAFASLASDLQKHEGTQGHSGLMLGLQLRMAGHLDTAAKVRKWVEDFA